MDYFTKCPEIDAISNQETPTVAEALFTNLFSRRSTTEAASITRQI
jgi:hypothetical protein